jgi:AcrR family transcriptional regulator
MKRSGSKQVFIKRDETTIERIMKAVAMMYRERGYERSSMSALARRVGITAPALYHYFKSKEEILGAFLEYTLNDLSQTLIAAARGGTSREKISNLVNALVKWQLQQTPFPGAYDRIFALGHLRQSLPPQLRKRIILIEKEIYNHCKGIITAGMSAGEFRRAAVAPVTFAILGIGDYILGWYRHDGKLSPSELAKIYADLIDAMLKPDQSDYRRSGSQRRVGSKTLS